MKNLLSFVFVALSMLAGFSACGGGGSAGTPQAAPTNGAIAPVEFTVNVPITSAIARKPKYLSPNTASVTVALVAVPPATPAPPLTINVTSGASDCSGGTCSGTLSAPIGQQQFVVTTYDSKGDVLSTGAVTVNVSPSSTSANVNSLTMTINGVATALQFSASPSTVMSGVPASITLTLNALDATGAVILAPGGYAGPVTLTQSDPNNLFTQTSGTSALPPNGTQVYTPATIPVTYPGLVTGIAGTATVTATATGPSGPITQTVTLTVALPPTPTPNPSATPTPTPMPTATPTPTPSPTPTPNFLVTPNTLNFAGPAPQPTQTFTASESGVPSFTAVSSNTSIATVTPSGTTFTVTAGATQGTAFITVSDGLGGHATVTVNVGASQTITIQSGSRTP